MTKTRVINFFGAPGAGKSTTAASLFAYMKRLNVNCELVIEYAKSVVWRNAHPILNNQLYIFAKQHDYQFRLKGKVDFIITDSPLLVSLYYGKNESNKFKDLVREKFHEFDNVNFYIQRTKGYNPIGRIQNEKESDDIGTDLLNLLLTENIPFERIESNEPTANIHTLLYEKLFED